MILYQIQKPKMNDQYGLYTSFHSENIEKYSLINMCEMQTTNFSQTKLKKPEIIDETFFEVNHAFNFYSPICSIQCLDKKIQANFMNEHRIVVRQAISQYLSKLNQDFGFQTDPENCVYYEENQLQSQKRMTVLQSRIESVLSYDQYSKLNIWLLEKPQWLQIFEIILEEIPHELGFDAIILIFLGLRFYREFQEEDKKNFSEFLQFIENKIEYSYQYLTMVSSEHSQSNKFLIAMYYTIGLAAHGSFRNSLFQAESNPLYIERELRSRLTNLKKRNKKKIQKYKTQKKKYLLL